MLGGLFTGHALTHLYLQGFVVLLPRLYKDLRLVPVEAGLLEGVRWLTMGLTSLLVGLSSDMFLHQRRLFLGLSLVLLGTGYFLVSLAPTYLLILMSLALAAVGVSLWHPPALGLLAQRFPQQRGLFMSLHRSLGSVGDVAGPILAGLLLLSLSWRGVLQLGLPLALFLAFLVWAVLHNLASPRVESPLKSSLGSQLGRLREAFRGWNMTLVMLVSVFQGMATRAIFLALPLYLSEQLGLSSLRIGVHISLLTFLGIGVGPLMGAVSDRWGRKSIITLAMFFSGLFALLMALTGAGAGLTLAVAGLGLFLFSVTSIVQASAIDIAEGMRLEGTLVGLLFGTNSLFGALSAFLVGVLAGALAQGGMPQWEVGFYYASALFLVAGVLSLRLPQTGGRRRAKA